MSFLELAKKRCSVRKFDGTPVSDEQLATILQAGRIAPTACNIQSQRIIVCNTDEALAKVKASTKYHFDAPLVLVICYNKAKSWKRSDFDGADYGIVDATIVTTHMMLAAADIGLGSTWVGYFDPAKAREVFELADDEEVIAFLPIGTPHPDYKPSALHDKRLSLQETVRNATE